MTPNVYLRRRANGLSLVELMVAITVGAILLGGTVTLFVSNKSAYEATGDLALLQENARFALQTIIPDLRHAGYFGCADDFGEVNNSTGISSDRLPDPINAIEGLDEAPAPWLESGGTDELTIRYLEGDGVDVTAGGSPTNTPVDSIADFEDGDYVGISNCMSADIVRIKSISGNTLIHTGLQANYRVTTDTQPTVAPFKEARYYVGVSAGKDGPSLLRETRNNPGQEQEIVEGVEAMQLLFGVDSDNDGAPNTYLVAGDSNLDEQTEWADVVSVRIGLLMRTVDEYGTDTDNATYNVNGTDINPSNDERRRRVFTATAFVRNLQ